MPPSNLRVSGTKTIAQWQSTYLACGKPQFEDPESQIESQGLERASLRMETVV